MPNTEDAFSTGTFSLTVINLIDMAELFAEVQTSQGNDVAKVYKTSNKKHQYEIRTDDHPSETDPIHHDISSKEAIRSNTSEFLESINHPDSGSDLRVYLK